MNYIQAYHLTRECSLALVYPPDGVYDPYPQDQQSAHVETTLNHSKGVQAVYCNA